MGKPATTNQTKNFWKYRNSCAIRSD